MPLLLQDLRCDVIRRSTYSLLHISLSLDLGGQSKIAYLSVHLVVDQNIAEFQIAMDDALTVDVNECLNDLTDVNPSLELRQSFSALCQVLQRVIPAVLQKDVYILLILKGIDELDDMLMSKRFVDLDLNQ